MRKGFPLGGSCPRSGLMRGKLALIARKRIAMAGTAPYNKKSTCLFHTGRCFFIRIYRLSIIRATISVAVLMYSAMLNCLTTRTS